MKGVVLDFDGVLARSMEQHAEAYRRLLVPFGVTVADEDIFAREGGRSESIIRDLLGPRGADTALVGRLANQKQELFRSLGVPALYPGAPELVHGLRKEAQRLGLVTGTRRANLEKIVPHLLPLFDAVLTADSGYTNDKPDPEPYLRAAERLALPVESCAALENAPLGVESARRAGYAFVVAVTSTVKEERLGRAHVVVRDLRDAARVLTGWLQHV